MTVKANCPIGCPCDNYDCENNGSDDGDAININGPISFEENNFISIEFKASSLPSESGWHEILIGKLILFAFKLN